MSVQEIENIFVKRVNEVRDGLLNFQIRRIFIRYNHFYLRSIGSSHTKN